MWGLRRTQGCKGAGKDVRPQWQICYPHSSTVSPLQMRTVSPLHGGEGGGERALVLDLARRAGGGQKAPYDTTQPH